MRMRINALVKRNLNRKLKQSYVEATANHSRNDSLCG